MWWAQQGLLPLTTLGQHRLLALPAQKKRFTTEAVNLQIPTLYFLWAQQGSNLRPKHYECPTLTN